MYILWASVFDAERIGFEYILFASEFDAEMIEFEYIYCGHQYLMQK